MNVGIRGIEGDIPGQSPLASPARTGWSEAAKKIAEAGDDSLVLGEFGDAGDVKLTW